ESELPGPASTARRNREPHCDRAQPLHQGRAGLQRVHPATAPKSDGDGNGLQGQAAVCGRERGGRQAGPKGGFQQITVGAPTSVPAVSGRRLRSPNANMSMWSRLARALLVPLVWVLALSPAFAGADAS